MLKINSLACKCPGDSVSFLPVLIFWLVGGAQRASSPSWLCPCGWVANGLQGSVLHSQKSKGDGGPAEVELRCWQGGGRG